MYKLSFGPAAAAPATGVDPGKKPFLTVRLCKAAGDVAAGRSSGRLSDLVADGAGVAASALATCRWPIAASEDVDDTGLEVVSVVCDESEMAVTTVLGGC